MDEMAPVMDPRQEEKEVRAGLRRKYLRQRLARIDTSQRDTRRDFTVVTNGRDLRRREDGGEVEDDSDDEEAAGNARQGTKNKQGKDADSDSDDDDEKHGHKQPVATLALPAPAPTLPAIPPPQLAPSTSTSLLAPASPTSPASPPTPTFPVLPPPPAVITMPPTTVVMTSTIVATPKASANPPVVNNPQIEPPPPSTTSTSISVMTTQPISLVSSISVTSQPRKGVSPDTTSSPTSSPTSTETSTQTTPFAFEKSSPTPSVSIEDVNKYGDDGRDQDRGGPPPRGLDPTAEHALISAGSIGKFEAFNTTSGQPSTDNFVIRGFYHRMFYLLDGMAHAQEV